MGICLSFLFSYDLQFFAPDSVPERREIDSNLFSVVKFLTSQDFSIHLYECECTEAIIMVSHK